VSTDNGVPCTVSATLTYCSIDCYPLGPGSLSPANAPYWQYTINLGSPDTCELDNTESMDDAGGQCLTHGQGTATPL
jgi:hypothetical protein